MTVVHVIQTKSQESNNTQICISYRSLINANSSTVC